MLFTDVIRRKRDGGELGDEEIAFFVRGLADDSLPAEQVSSLAMAIFPIRRLVALDACRSPIPVSSTRS